MTPALGLLIICYTGICLVATFIDGICTFVEAEDYTLMTPITLYENTEMNWFGCIACWLLFGLVSPIVFIFKLGYFLFHL